MRGDYYTGLGWLPLQSARVQDLLSKKLEFNWGDIAQASRYRLTEPQLRKLAQLALSIEREIDEANPPTKLLILSNCTASHLVAPIVASGYRHGLNLKVDVIEYGAAIDKIIGDAGSLKQTFSPDIVLLAIDQYALQSALANRLKVTEQDTLKNLTELYEDLIAKSSRVSKQLVITQTVVPNLQSDFGNADRKIFGSLRRIIHKLNEHIVSTTPALFDVEWIASKIGLYEWFDAKMYVSAKIPFRLEYVPVYCEELCRVIASNRGGGRKVAVLDLDNTIWGGVVGDDGVQKIEIGGETALGQAFLSFQERLLTLNQRGILLAVCSKNNEDVARDAFKLRREMLLKESDISCFSANWENKVDNIRKISAELSLLTDSFVFVDDNPAERDIVRQFMPEVAVLELPTDPVDYKYALDASGLFETVIFSEEDKRRAEQYEHRKILKSVSPENYVDYLMTLEMKLELQPLSDSNADRVYQLINKTNQFNLTGARISGGDMLEYKQNLSYQVFVATLTDKYTDHGIISALIGNRRGSQLMIENWVMSCRVLGRNLETQIFKTIASLFQKKGCKYVQAKYIASGKNQLVENLYRDLGFTQIESASAFSLWEYPLSQEIREERFLKIHVNI